MKVGSLVECVRELTPKRGNFLLPGEICPIPGNIYTVREIENTKSGTGIMLYEIVNPVFSFSDSYGERLFNIKSFRELLPPMEAEIKELLEQHQLA